MQIAIASGKGGTGIDPEVVMAGDAGTPLFRDGPQSVAAKSFAKVVDSIIAGKPKSISTARGLSNEA